MPRRIGSHLFFPTDTHRSPQGRGALCLFACWLACSIEFVHAFTPANTHTGWSGSFACGRAMGCALIKRFTHTHTHAHIRTRTRTRTRTHTRTHPHATMDEHAPSCKHTQAWTSARTHPHASAQASTHACTRTPTHTHARRQMWHTLAARARQPTMSTRVYCACVTRQDAHMRHTQHPFSMYRCL